MRAVFPALLLRLFLVLVILLPIPFGGNRPAAWYAYAMVIAAIALIWVLVKLTRSGSVSLSLNPVLVLLFLAPCAWALLQIWPGFAGDWNHPAWSLAGVSGGLAVNGTISIAPDRTVEALIRLLSYGLTFYLALQFARNQANARIIFRWLAIAGTVYAAFGLLVYWGWFEEVFWRAVWSPGDVTATFRNRNNFATWVGLAMVVLFSILVRANLPSHRPRRLESLGQQQQLERFIMMSWKPAIGFIVVLAALFLTHSRGGFAASALAVAAFAVCLVARKRGIGDRATQLALVLAVLLLIVWTLTGEGLLWRLEQTSFEGEGRDEVFRILLAAIAADPWLGTGYGTFADAFHLFNDSTVALDYDLAHNTYLENAVELGVPATASLVLSIGLAGIICARGVVIRHRDWIYPATGVAATVLVGAHALVDFSLQIPAVAVTYATILGVAVAQSYPLEKSSRDHVDGPS